MKEWFYSLERRERILVAAGAAVVVLAMIYVLVLEPLFVGVSERDKRIVEKQQLLGWMEGMAANLPPDASGSTSPEQGSLVVIFGQAVRRAGLQQHLKETLPSGDNGVRARFERVPFDRLVQMLGQLQREQQLQITTASFDRGTPAGTTDARLTLERTGT